MERDNYWIRKANARLSRRNVLGGMASLGAGATALGIVGCGGDDDDTGASPTSENGGEAPEATATTGNGAQTGGAGELINGEEQYLGKSPVPGGQLSLSYTTDPVTWDPHQTTSINTHTRTCLFNSPMLQYQFGPEHGVADVTASGNLASEWEQIEETTVRFVIQPDAHWTERAPLNGRALTSGDIKFSLDRILELPAPYAGIYQEIDSIETPDDSTLLIHTKAPYAPLFNYLAHYYAQVVAPEVVDQFGDLADPESAKSLGIGPFELESFQPSTEMRFTRRENYFRDGQPYLDAVSLRNIADPNAQLAELRSGELDTLGLNFDNMDSVTDARNDLLVMQSLSVVAWLITARSDKAPTNDERVRQAISMAIDREGWLSSLYHGEGTIDNGPIQALWSDWRLPPGELGEGDKYFEYNPEEAKALLEAAGVENIDTTFSFFPYSASVAEHPELLKDMLQPIGINLNVDLMEYGAFVNAVMTSNPTYDPLSYAGVRFMGDPDEMLWDMYHPTGSKNFAVVDDPELTTLLEKQRQTLDLEERREVVNDIQRYLAVKRYYIYTPSYAQVDSWQPWVANYRNHVSYDHGNMLRGVWLDESLRG